VSTSCLPNAYVRRHFDAIDLSTTPRTLPELTPVYLAFTLALELATAASHSSSTFMAHPIQNAGDHFRSRFEPAQSDKYHISPPPSHRTISIDNPVLQNRHFPAKASCTVRLLSGDRSRKWCRSIGTTDSQSAMAASLTCKPVELPTVSNERLPSAVRARNKPRSFTRLQTRGQLAKGFALDIPSKTRTKFSFRGV